MAQETNGSPEPLECAIPVDPPRGFARVRWRGPGVKEGEGAAGFWVSDDAMIAAAVRADQCKSALSTCIVDREVAKKKSAGPRWIMWSIGIVGGVMAGYLAARTTK